jgi:hypothetical protein
MIKKFSLFLLLVLLFSSGCDNAKSSINNNYKTIDKYVFYLCELVEKSDISAFLGEFRTSAGFIRYFGPNDEVETWPFEYFRKGIQEKKSWYGYFFDTNIYVEEQKSFVSNDVEEENFQLKKHMFVSFKELLIEKKYKLLIRENYTKDAYFVYFDLPDNWPVNGFIMSKMDDKFYVSGIISGMPRLFMPK